MKKTRTLAIQTVIAALMPAVGYCAYPTMDEAQALFSSELMNSTNVCMSGAYDDFRGRLCQSASPDVQHAVESVVIGGITSIVVHVSTNLVDESVGVGIIEDRGSYFRALGYSLHDFRTNAVECVDIAKYIGIVTGVDFPSDLARSRGFGMRMLLSTNETELAQWRQQEEPLREARREKRNLQTRVWLANEAVRRYRSCLFSLCGHSVAGCSKIMSDVEFSTFTNELVSVSNASSEEQRVLFWKLHNDAKFMNND